ncbi:MAG: hypothetical protein QOE83_420 [Actinomycetota bacterium]|nr:hypothetical protein [Actinomycetota bacterium]
MSAGGSSRPRPGSATSSLPEGPPSPRVKVLHVITRFSAGAGGNTLVSAAGMDPARYDVWIAGCAGGELWARAETAGVRTFVVPHLRHEPAPLDDMRALTELAALMRREQFTIVHVHSAKAGFLGRAAARLAGVPVVIYSLHGRDPWWPDERGGSPSSARSTMSPLRRTAFLALERSLRGWTDAFVAVAPRVARNAIEARVARPGSVRVAFSAVELDDIPQTADPDVRTELGIGEDVPLIGTVGRIDAQKAPLDFVRMASEVRRAHPNAVFVMVGEGSMQPEAAAEAALLGLEIRFLGHRSDAPRIASAFDVFVISSLYEGVGRAVTEAMAAGRPVVSTAVDGIVDVIDSGVTGLLAEPGYPDGLAERVVWMLDHPAAAAAMGHRARAKVRAMFAPATMCAVLDELYCRSLGLPVPPVTDEEPEVEDPAEAIRLRRLPSVTALTPRAASTEGTPRG